MHVVAGGQSFEAADFSVSAHGKDHAVILPEWGVPCENIGFLIDDAVYHPGDSFTQPDRAVHTNLVPISGPWFALPPAVEYARAVKSEQTVGIHDALLEPDRPEHVLPLLQRRRPPVPRSDVRSVPRDQLNSASTKSATGR